MFKGLFKFISRVLGVSSTTYIGMFTLARRKSFVGSDELGNKYYEAPAMPTYDHSRRWVIYKNSPDPALIPPRWHAWLHHQSDTFPSADDECAILPTPMPPKRSNPVHQRGTYRAWRPNSK